jgi:gas vesicle protein
MDDALEVMGGLVLGALVGGAIALLLVPCSGRDTRAAIRGRINLVIEEGRRAAAEKRAELEAQFAEAKRFPKPA